MIDEATKRSALEHYVRVLLDIDLFKRLFDEIMVEHEGFTFYVEVVYERLSNYCTHCKSIGNSVTYCNKLHHNEKKTDV
jgi:hypothetical protein